jgi:hypothetical protein
VKNLFFALAAAALISACAVPRISGPDGVPSGPGAASVFEKQVFKFTKTPDPDLEQALEGMLSDSYALAVRNHTGDKPMEIGFTYSLSPRGAVYPFSEIEISCIMQDRFAGRYGRELCGDFFTQFGARLEKALADKQ